MAISFNPLDILSGFNLTKLNQNFQNIKTSLTDGLSRSGSGSNQMEADIDLNSNDLLNVGKVNAEEIIVDGVKLTPTELVDTSNFATAAQGDKADGAVQRLGNETKTNDLRITDGLLKVFKNLQTVPVSEDDAGLIASFNRSAADGETNLRNMYVHPTPEGATKSFVLSQVTSEGVSEVDLLTLYRNGRAAVGDIGWLESIASQAETVSMFTSLSKPGGNALAITGATRTSDAVAPAYFSSIGVWGFSHNNRARTGDFNTTFMGWAGYYENRRDNGSGRSHGIEIGSVNMGAAGIDPEASIMSPYDYAQPNSINGLLLSAGRPDVGVNQHNISNAINIIANSAVYRTGIVFGTGSVALDGATAPAISMPAQYGLRWYTTEGLRGYFHSDQTAGSQTIGGVIRNDRVDLEFQGATKIQIKTDSVRAIDTNGGFDGNATYIPNLTASRQFRFATFDPSFPNLYLETNTNTVASPVWSNRGQFNAVTGAYTNVSDERLKNKMGRFDRDIWEVVNGLSDATWLYSMKADENETKQFGFMAQDVNKVLPEAVTEEDIMYVNDRPIVAALSLAVANLNKRLESIENK